MDIYTEVREVLTDGLRDGWLEPADLEALSAAWETIGDDDQARRELLTTWFSQLAERAADPLEVFRVSTRGGMVDGLIDPTEVIGLVGNLTDAIGDGDDDPFSMVRIWQAVLTERRVRRATCGG